MYLFVPCNLHEYSLEALTIIGNMILNKAENIL